MNLRFRPNLIDKAIGYINPQSGLRRMRARAMSTLLESTTPGYSQNGSSQAMQYTQGAGYKTPGSNTRALRGFYTKSNSADVDTIPKLNPARAGSRDLFMNAPIATGILMRCRTNIVGYGLTLQSRIDRDLLQLSEEQAAAWEKKTEREFAIWASSQNCDFVRTQNFYELQGLALLSTLMSGDVFAAMPYSPIKDFPYDLRVRIIEADQVTNAQWMIDTNWCAGGVQVDDNGAPVMYHILRNHPGGFLPIWIWDEFDVFGKESGRRQILHLYDKLRPGQRRGMPLLAPVIEKLKQIARLSDSELMAAVVTSFFTAFIKSDLGGGDVLSDTLDSQDKIANTNLVASDKNVYEMGSGAIFGLAPGEDITLADPKRPNALFQPFFEAMCKEIGAAVELPAELILLQFNTSYTAAKAAINEAWNFFYYKRSWLSREFCQPIYKEWLFEAVTKGRIDAPGFFLDVAVREAWSGSKWTGPGQGQLNPLVETQAALERIAGNISTHTKEVAAIDGDNWDSMVTERASEKNLLKKLGIEEGMTAVKPPVKPNTNKEKQPPDESMPMKQMPDMEEEEES